jgi:hypothetical protein
VLLESLLFVLENSLYSITKPCFSNYFHEKKYFSSRQEIFFFMKVNLFVHEEKSPTKGCLLC